ncbi:hypothetical protein UVI_02026020 [Ustilaginoidea virens]|nr:hypothetical protein UVI_02026020 [Ustilaginoidea virens]
MNFTPRPYELGETIATQFSSHSESRYRHDDAPLHHTDLDRQDETGDVFMRIAREEPVHGLRGASNDDDASSVSGLRRTSHRRPLSTTVAAYHPSSPPRVRRRLSDQQDRPRPKYLEDDQGSELSRTTTTFRGFTREGAASAHPGEEISRIRSGLVNLRPSPLSARSVVGIDSSQDGSVYARRRASITESNNTLTTIGGRTVGYKATGLNHGRNYGSSPLVKTVDYQSRVAAEVGHGMEGTESTASTTAPSTVWDELDDLKSRIHRLELTGKLPSTSGAAVSRLSDDRPATATTTVTTMSLSPKRQAAGQATEVSSTTACQKEAHPLLHAALFKSKPFLSPEVHQALESAANDAMALSSMMGAPGQPGPMSGAASTIGAPGTLTDRQLRRKADSVCRSLTELCVALGDGLAQSNAPSTLPVMAQHDGPATPTVLKSWSGLPAPRRPSVAEQGLPKSSSSSSSPRVLSKFEERRSLMLGGTSVPRTAGSAPTTPVEGNPTRRSSLLIARTRRAAAEEPDLGRTPTVLRSRRAGTEEPEDGRQSSLFFRHRRGTVGEDGEGARFRPPSRAGTDVNMVRGQGRELVSGAHEGTSSPAPSALPRRRFLSTNLHSSRLAGPSASSAASPRRYADRPTGDADMDEGAGGSSLQRQGPPLSKGMVHARASSLSARRSRDNQGLNNTGAATGTYR